MNTIEILSILTIAFFSLLGIFLLSSSISRKRGFHWLGVLFILLAINFLDGLFILNGITIQYPRLAFWEDPVTFLYGPLIYFFSLQFCSTKWKFSLKSTPHLIPFILFEFFVVIFHLTTSRERISEILESLIVNQSGLNFLIALLPVYIHILVYLLLARKKLFQHKKDLKQFYSKVDLSWAFSLMNVITIIFISALLIGMAQNFGPKSLFQVFILSVIIISTGLSFYVLLRALNQPMFQHPARLSPAPEISTEEIESVKDKVTELLKGQKVYSNPELTLKEVASEIGETERLVSHVIKKTLAENFYDLINSYRISEAQRIFKESPDRKLTVLEVLYQVGFNSKSSFNTEFKKRTGMTPTEYRSQLK